MAENKKFLKIEENDIDVLEQDIHELDPALLKILLSDKTTGRNIRWACDEYAKYGELYQADKEIFPRLIIGKHTQIIQPRVAKTKNEQRDRTRKVAEVFTPSWICNEMNNHCDTEWFGYKSPFNTETEKGWITNYDKIAFPKKREKSWRKYVLSTRLEITCGEAPYLVSRYDTVSGKFIPVNDRIGLLDRKLRVINENVEQEDLWLRWANKAFQSIYGYEYQGDNLLLARENLLLTFKDNYEYKFKTPPKVKDLKKIATIIAWNIWQMDGLNDTVPFSTSESSENQLELFDDLPKIYTPTLCKIKDWRSKEIFYFQDLKKGTKNEV